MEKWSKRKIDKKEDKIIKIVSVKRNNYFSNKLSRKGLFQRVVRNRLAKNLRLNRETRNFQLDGETARIEHRKT